MDATGYIEARADLLVDLSEVVAKRTSDFGARFRELLERPDLRSDLIIEEACGYLGERRAEESGDVADGEAWGAELAMWCDLSWEEIHEEPPATRGDTWATARRLVLVICERQAMFEAAAGEVLGVGAEMSKVTSAAGAMPDAEKRKAATEGATAEAVKKISKARALAAAAVEQPEANVVPA